MDARYHSLDPLTVPQSVSAKCRMQDLEREIEQIHLVKRARATRRRQGAPLTTLLLWMRTRLAARPQYQVGSLQPAPQGEVAAR